MIEGLDSLNKKLEKLANITLEEAITRGCLRVERDAKILVPVDTSVLQKSITHNVEGNVGEVGTSIEYAPKVELGLGQKAQPFLQPALEMNREVIKEEIIMAINNEAKRL